MVLMGTPISQDSSLKPWFISYLRSMLFSRKAVLETLPSLASADMIFRGLLFFKMPLHISYCTQLLEISLPGRSPWLHIRYHLTYSGGCRCCPFYKWVEAFWWYEHWTKVLVNHKQVCFLLVVNPTRSCSQVSGSRSWWTQEVQGQTNESSHPEYVS